MYRILIVEDDPVIAGAMSRQIGLWGFQVKCAEDFRDITGEFKRFEPHLVLLDIMLPFYDGYYWCSELRRFSKVPIVFLSSASDNMNIVMAMNMGGDDFIAKPFDLNVLTAKIQAVLRRAYDFAPGTEPDGSRAGMPYERSGPESGGMQTGANRAGPGMPPEPNGMQCGANQAVFGMSPEAGTSAWNRIAEPALEHRGAVLDTSDASLAFQGKKIELTKNEYRILQTLLADKGRIVSRDKLMLRLWETDSFVDENTLTVNITRLRRKLAREGLEDFITTRKGLGYMIRE